MSRANLFSLLSPLSPAPGGLIWSDQNGPRPEKPYATVSVRTLDPSPPVRSEVDAGGSLTLSQMVRLAVEWQFIGKGAFDSAISAGLKIRSDSQADAAKSLGLGIGNVDSVYGVPTILNASQIEERAIVELIVFDSNSLTDFVGIVEEVEISGDEHACNITVRKDENG